MSEDAPVDLSSFSDSELLRRFAKTHDEAAFRQIVDRHGGLVLGTCRRGLHCAADADDAFQATFLVLARSASKIRSGDALAAWLYGVATRICQRMRRDANRRTTQELMETDGRHVDPLDELLARHDEVVADEELNALPSALRLPLVLRYLAGKSNAEVAEELGITVAALEGRLKRGKQRLRIRLLRRGVTLAAVVITLKATRVLASEVPAHLAESTVAAATSGATASVASLAGESSTSTHFALQELNAMNASILTKPIVAALGLGGIAAAVLTAQVAFSQGGNGGGGADPFALDAEVSDRPASDPPGGSTIATNDPNVDPSDVLGAASGPAPSSFASPSSPPSTVASGPAAPLPDALNTVYQPRIVDLKQRTPTEQQIEEALPRPLTDLGLDFTETPLEEIVAFLREEYEIEIEIDERGLDDEGASPVTPVTVSLRNISLESALNIMLRPHGLTYLVDNEVLLITGVSEAETRMETRVYPAGGSMGDAENIIELITETVAPSTWRARYHQDGEGWPTGSGEGTISVAVPDKLVIRQTYAVHREINKLLSQLNGK